MKYGLSFSLFLLLCLVLIAWVLPAFGRGTRQRRGGWRWVAQAHSSAGVGAWMRVDEAGMQRERYPLEQHLWAAKI